MEPYIDRIWGRLHDIHFRLTNGEVENKLSFSTDLSHFSLSVASIFLPLSQGLGMRAKPPLSGAKIRSLAKIKNSGELRMSINQLNTLFMDFMQFYAHFFYFCTLKN
ncbi:MAG: hypothetical protein EWV88_15025 [Microcystis wesenbergii Mw_MB_S_20031200_S109D]|uniref:Uncharacterized protein n=1 Tax=Microcystis wesenbergii Mw_MB_S_20031200_S109D TaxID=2486241 RepID=A0A552LMK4_9CHRO|nr:MAG: hypothetical protein EWV88_15025 [Microcystis wesenbergii Mw_MB_S_20031200_S109D]